MSKVELLAPAGNYSKFKTALYFGADAVYIGGKDFSLRAFSDNFSDEEIEKAVKEAHEKNVKIYVTVNIFARNYDFCKAAEYFRFLENINVDAVLITDPGLISLCKEVAPNLKIHLSTQANTLNKYAVRFWAKQGVERVVLARELSLAEIKEIHEFCPETQLEAFVHGAMCISYSGRCLLSDYLDGRSSNRGACVQCCRWKYEIRALNPTNGDTGWLPLEEDGRGAYILNGKDLNMIEELSALKNAGVNSFKIEGRMKSEYYLATVVNAYRRALNGEDVSRCERELYAVAHRNYTKAYAYGNNAKTEEYSAGQVKGEYDYVANVLSCENGRVRAEMRNRFRGGETLCVLSPSDNYGKEFSVKNMFSENENAASDDAKLVQGIYSFDCPYPLREGDILRRRA